jgi:hypothetical protein
MVHRSIIFIVSLALVGCQTPDYAQRDSTTQIAADNVIRYGSIGGAGVGGYFAGREIGGNVESGVMGATAGAGLAYGLNKMIDWFRGRAYKNGKLDGAAEARAEILKDMWEREAVYGISDDKKKREVRTRRVYVPERTVNGVVLAGGYQTVEVVY